jgi:hypothetical protein
LSFVLKLAVALIKELVIHLHEKLDSIVDEPNKKIYIVTWYIELSGIKLTRE